MSETGPWVDHGTVSSVWSRDQIFFPIWTSKIFHRAIALALRHPQLELGYYSSYHNFDDTFKWVYKSKKLTGSIYFDIGRPENVEVRLRLEFTMLYKAYTGRSYTLQNDVTIGLRDNSQGLSESRYVNIVKYGAI